MEISEHKRNFWAALARPFFVMAPMADVTDAAFRYMIAKYGKPDVLITEFVSVDGLCSAGRKPLLRTLVYDEIERPIVAQFFGEKPDHFYECAQLAQELGFDGIDLNMGCPVKTVVKTGSGAALIKSPELAKEIIRETVRGAGPLPVTVKTRIGYNKIIMLEWLKHLLETDLAAITLHLRTAKEMSLVDAHWELMADAATMVKQTDTLILGNGDVRDIPHARELVAQTGIDGVMLGRAIFGNPWLYNESIRREEISLETKLQAMVEHARLYEEVFGGLKNFAVMQKHLRAYASGFDGAKELRRSFENVKNADQVEEITQAFLRGTLNFVPES